MDPSEESFILEPMLNFGPFFVYHHNTFQSCAKIYHDLFLGIIRNSPSFSFNVALVSCGVRGVIV